MPKRVPKHTVITARNGKIVHAAPGKPFEFTAEEIDHITERHGADFLRRHTVEVADPEGDDEGGDGSDGKAAGEGSEAASTNKPKPTAKKTSASGL